MAPLRRRWGEADQEKDTVYLFPAERTDEGAMPRGDLEPTRSYPRQILSLLRLPFRHSCF